MLWPQLTCRLCTRPAMRPGGAAAASMACRVVLCLPLASDPPCLLAGDECLKALRMAPRGSVLEGPQADVAHEACDVSVGHEKFGACCTDTIR